MKILLLAEPGSPFQARYAARMREELVRLGHVVDIAHHHAGHTIDHVHACFAQDLVGLASAVTPAATWSFSTFGVASLGDRAQRAALDALLARPDVTRGIVHSIAPARARARADVDHDKLAWMHDPVYDDVRDFDIDREAARAALGLPTDRRIALWFGKVSRKKGADLLAAAARQVLDVTFVFAGEGVARAVEPSANIVIVDRVVEYPVAAKYFRACDLVVLPYRRDYEDDTSGVFVQAALAGRPVLAPAISPFRDVIAAYDLGATFECENVDALAAFVATGAIATGCARYCEAIEPWSHLARTIWGAA